MYGATLQGDVDYEPPSRVKWHGKISICVAGLLCTALYISQNEDRIANFGKAIYVSSLMGDMRKCKFCSNIPFSGI